MDCDNCFWFFNGSCTMPMDMDLVGCNCSLYEKNIFGEWVINVHGRLWRL